MPTNAMNSPDRNVAPAAVQFAAMVLDETRRGSTVFADPSTRAAAANASSARPDHGLPTHDASGATAAPMAATSWFTGARVAFHAPATCNAATEPTTANS